MSLEKLAQILPDYAKDLKLNLSTVMRQSELTPQQAWGTAVASALASRNPALIDAVFADAAGQVSPETINAAKTAAALMGMNNIYYRFLHLVGNEKYSTIPARLRMNGMRTHGADHNDFELWSTAVSAINGCGACVASHASALASRGVTEETIAAAVRIASVLHAIAAVLDTEACVAKTV
jgi:alkyl hydroperoxide reductase subunit D